MHIDKYTPLQREFYTGNDVVQIAHDLLGKILYTYFDNEISAGVIIETEAYAGISDKASHAYNNRKTARTEIMYMNGGYAYVYLCYGIHALFNIVTSVQSDPQAVLIRGIEPIVGFDIMNKRTARSSILPKNGIGPGNVSKLLGIKVCHTGFNLCHDKFSGNNIWIEDNNLIVHESEVKIGPRIGVEYAKGDALLPYRFQWSKKE
jgi:DNA-3-methyladenine glycosylase